MREGENPEAEIDKYRGLADEGKRPHGLLHRDLGDGGEVVVGVVRHDEAAEEDGHDAGQVDALGQGVGGVDKAEHQGELQAGVGVQVDVLQHQRADQGHQGADGGTAKEDAEEPGDSPANLAENSDIPFALRLNDRGSEDDGHSVVQNTLSEHQHVQHWINIQH